MTLIQHSLEVWGLLCMNLYKPKAYKRDFTIFILKSSLFLLKIKINKTRSVVGSDCRSVIIVTLTDEKENTEEYQQSGR